MRKNSNYISEFTGNYKIKSLDPYKNEGYTLVELLVVSLIFTILGYVIIQSLALSLRGSRKSENLGQVKGNLEYAMNVMERHLRSARRIVNCNSTQIVYADEYNSNPNPQFVCSGGINGYIASGSARLTSDQIYVNCTVGSVFLCPTPVPGYEVPPSIIINISGRDAASTGAEGANITSTTKLLLRNY